MKAREFDLNEIEKCASGCGSKCCCHCENDNDEGEKNIVPRLIIGAVMFAAAMIVSHIGTKEKRKDLKKQTPKTAQILDMATRYEVKRKGKKQVLRIPTIDAGRNSILCIKEITLSLQIEK